MVYLAAGVALPLLLQRGVDALLSAMGRLRRPFGAGRESGGRRLNGK